MALKLDKKVNTSLSLREGTLELLKVHKKTHGVSMSWLVDTLLSKYLEGWKDLNYEEE